LIDQLSRLFKNLSDIVPTIIIAGNHDCNLNNLNRLDCLRHAQEESLDLAVYLQKLIDIEVINNKKK